jgi:hypothetical protein
MIYVSYGLATLSISYQELQTYLSASHHHPLQIYLVRPVLNGSRPSASAVVEDEKIGHACIYKKKLAVLAFFGLQS